MTDFLPKQSVAAESAASTGAVADPVSAIAKAAEKAFEFLGVVVKFGQQLAAYNQASLDEFWRRLKENGVKYRNPFERVIDNRLGSNTTIMYVLVGVVLLVIVGMIFSKPRN